MSDTIHVNGIELNVLVDGEGPDVLLVHGFPDDHRVWRHQIPALVAAGYRVVAPDLRGCGDSEVLPRVSDYAMPHLVADLVGLLDALEISDVRLVAHDWGAFIGWHLCAAHPKRIERYVALSVGHPAAYMASSLKQKLKSYYVLLFQLRGVTEWALRRNRWKLLERVTGYPEEMPHWVATLSRPGRLTAALNYYRANLGYFVRGAPPATRAAVMGMWSEDDIALCEEQMVGTREHVQGSWRYERIEGANHWLQLSAPEAVNRRLLDYLAAELS